MLKAIYTALMYEIRHLLGTNLKLIRCAIGQTFQDPRQALNKSFLILLPMVAKESPSTSPRYKKKTIMKTGHHTSWSTATLEQTWTASVPGIISSR